MLLFMQTFTHLLRGEGFNLGGGGVTARSGPTSNMLVKVFCEAAGDLGAVGGERL